MSAIARQKEAEPSVLSLAQLLEQQPPTAPPCLVEPGLLPPQGILFVGGEPKVGKSLLVANLALSLAAGSDRTGFPIPAPRRVLVCQFELPVPQFVGRLATMRRILGNTADQNLFVDTRATGHLLNAPQGLNHFLSAARAAAAEIIVLDPLYSTHDQDENDTRAMAALCQSLLRLREASRAALIVVHHVRKSIGRYEIGSAFRGSSALHAVGDSYLLLTRPAPQFHTVELRFQFRYAAPQPPRLLDLDPDTLWFSPAGQPAPTAPARRKVEAADITQALADLGGEARYNQLREQIMTLTECSKRTAQLAITAGLPARLDRGRQRPLPLARVAIRFIDCPHGVAPERMPKADATELAPKKSAYRNPPAHTPSVLEGFWFLSRATQRFLRSAHFFGEAPSGGLGLSNAKIARLLFARRSKSRLLGPSGRRDTGVAYTGEYPIPRASSADTFSSAPRRREAEKPAGDYRENVGGDNCGALHWSTGVTASCCPGAIAPMATVELAPFVSAIPNGDSSIESCSQVSNTPVSPFEIM